MHDDTRSAIRSNASIPTLPAVATRFLELSTDPECEYDDLVDLLSTDPGIVGAILKLANSALFGVSRTIGSVKQALVLLGLSKVRSLVLSRFMIQEMNQWACPELSLAHYWRRSVSCAALTARLCEAVDRTRREEAFVAGLLADVGVMVLARALPDRYAPVARDYEPLHSEAWLAREQHAMGIGHAEVSAMVLSDWQLPEIIVTAVRCHHDDGPNSADIDPGGRLGRLVAAASCCTQLLCEAPDDSRVADTCRKMVYLTGLPMVTVLGALVSIEEVIEDIVSLLNLKVAPLADRTPVTTRLAARMDASA